MTLKYICERNTELFRRQLVKYDEIGNDVTDIKRNQIITILPKINHLLGEFGLLKQTVTSLCEAIFEEQPR
jgi:hypothetical protein